MSNSFLVGRIKPKRILAILLGATAVLAILNLVALYLRFFPERYHIYSRLHEFAVDTFINQFTMNNEMNIPTYVSSFQLFFASMLLFVIAVWKWARTDKYRLQWLGLAFLLLAFSIDEFVAFHETLAKLFKDFPDFYGLFAFKWLFGGIIFLLVFGLLYLGFFLHLERKYKALFFFSTLLYFTGAVGFEVIGGRFANYNNTRNITFFLISTVEEVFEPSGVALLIYSLLEYMKDLFPEFRFSLDG